MIIFERCCQCGDAQGEHNMSFNQLTQISQNKHIGSLNPLHFGEECMIAKELTSNLSAAAPSRQEALQWGFGKTLPITGSCPVWNPANGPPWLLCVILIIVNSWSSSFTRPDAMVDLNWIIEQGTVWAGTFWDVLNVSLCASGLNMGTVSEGRF